MGYSGSKNVSPGGRIMLYRTKRDIKWTIYGRNGKPTKEEGFTLGEADVPEGSLLVPISDRLTFSPDFPLYMIIKTKYVVGYWSEPPNDLMELVK
jgi:hypothetical protein